MYNSCWKLWPGRPEELRTEAAFDKRWKIFGSSWNVSSQKIGFTTKILIRKDLEVHWSSVLKHVHVSIPHHEVNKLAERLHGFLSAAKIYGMIYYAVQGL